MMKPFMFYAINKLEIENYLTIELNGDNPHLVKRSLQDVMLRNSLEIIQKILIKGY